MNYQLKFRIFSLFSILSILLSAVGTPTVAVAAPPMVDGDGVFTFASISDMHSSENFDVILSQVNSLNPDLIINNGDLENEGANSSELGTMVTFIKAAGLFDKMFMVRGNHDNELPGSAGFWENYFETPPNVKTLPSSVTDYVSIDSNSDTLTYSFIYENSMFVGLDVPGDVDMLTTAQLNWLDTRLTYAESQGLTHAFIYFHGPMYCVESNHCNSSDRTDATSTPAGLITVVNNHPIVSAFLHGHEHVLTWTHMDNTRLTALTGSFEQFVTSPAGGMNYASYIFPDRVDYYHNTSEERQGFTTISVNGNSFTYTIYEDGVATPIWSKTFTKGTPPNTPPTVTTQAATAIAATTATGNGTFIGLGIPLATQHGVVWDTAANPTIALTTKTQQGIPAGSGPFTSSMTGLSPNTLYHVRAYATNTEGTVYGDDVTFTTYLAPSVTTQEVTNTTQTSATGNGNVTALGIPNPTQHGVCWATTANPTVANSHTSDGPMNATGAFTSNITGLNPGTLYHARAYATNAGGTSYGEDVQFTTSASTMVTFTESGIWSAPEGITSVTVEVWGGGGRGASITSGTSSEIAGGGGGGGAYSRSVISVTPEQTYTFVVGAGSSTTAPGGDSYFIDAATLMAKGGGSAADNSSTAASGGSSNSGVGTNRYAGGNGASGSLSGNRGGGGGSSAGTSARGNNASGASGATAPSGGGNGGSAASNASGNGNTGSVPGGGGGGAYRTSGTATYEGGAGANGQVRLTYYIGVNSTTTTVNCGAGTPSLIIGGSINCVATVTAGSGTLSPTGTVSWATNGAGGFTTSPCTLSGTGGSASCSVTYTPSSIGTGSHLITATYSGSLNFAASTGNQNVRVTQAGFTFAAMGDAQPIDEFEVTVNQIDSLNPDFVLFNGDLVETELSAAELNPMVAVLKNAGLFDKTFLVRGNHDDHTSASAAFWENYFETPPNVKTLPPGVTDYVAIDSNSDTLTYSFIYGNSMFIGLDVPGDADLLTTAQLNWLDARLTYAESQGLTHAFVFFHGPMYCVEGIHCDCEIRTDVGCTPSGLVTVINAHPIISAFIHGSERVLSWTHMDNTRVAWLTTSFEQFITSPAGGMNYASYVYPERVDYFYNGSIDANGFATISVSGSAFTYSIYADGNPTPVWSKIFYEGPPAAPVVTTQAVTNITTTTATANGNITDLGVPFPSEHGFVWSTSPNPTIADSKTTEGSVSAPGAFSGSITELMEGTLYHVRAYATNDTGTVYGADITFTSYSAPNVSTEAVTNIGAFSATGNGNVTDLGVPNPTEHGFVWSTSPYPTLANNKTTEGSVSAAGTFTGNITGLTMGTLYHVRAYATNAVDTSYGEDVTFTTLIAPTVTTQPVTNITQTTATGNGNITDLGSSNPTQHGFVWSTSPNPTTADSKTTNGPVSATGAFTSTITSLTLGTVYHIRAYATNSADTSYGEDVIFITIGIAPTVTTQAVTNIGATTATGNGNITNLGAPNPIQHGVVWDTAPSPTIALSTKTQQGAPTGTGAFTSSMTGLTPGTLYHVRAYAINNEGTVYGQDVTFTTYYNSAPITTATVIAGTGTNVSGIGTVPWSNPGNITVDDTSYATAALNNATSQYLFATNFGFAIPDNATIVGIRATIWRYSSWGIGADVRDNTVQLIKNGSVVGNNKALTTTDWPTSGNSVNYGSSSDLWGTTWTPAEINASNFGFALSARSDNNRTAYVDTMQIAVTYTVPVAPASPTVTTQAATNITSSTATANGTITNLGMPNPTQHGVVWDTAPNPTIALSTKTEQGPRPTTGAFTSSITGLSLYTVYHVRAYATNATGTSYGEDVTFTTLGVVPTVITQSPVTNITQSTALTGGDITSFGIPNPTQHGVVWGTSSNPTIVLSTKTQQGAPAGTGPFTSVITGLTPGTHYHVRAYVTNYSGTAYGSDVEFTTAAESVVTFNSSGTWTAPASAYSITVEVWGGGGSGGNLSGGSGEDDRGGGGEERILARQISR